MVAASTSNFDVHIHTWLIFEHYCVPLAQWRLHWVNYSNPWLTWHLCINWSCQFCKVVKISSIMGASSKVMGESCYDSVWGVANSLQCLLKSQTPTIMVANDGVPSLTHIVPNLQPLITPFAAPFPPILMQPIPAIPLFFLLSFQLIINEQVEISRENVS
jgi:hypothetical protein